MKLEMGPKRLLTRVQSPLPASWDISGEASQWQPQRHQSWFSDISLMTMTVLLKPPVPTCPVSGLCCQPKWPGKGRKLPFEQGWLDLQNENMGMLRVEF